MQNNVQSMYNNAKQLEKQNNQRIRKQQNELNNSGINNSGTNSNIYS